MPNLRRTLVSSGNFIVVLVLLGVLFIMVNYVSSRRYARWDFTEQRLSALSDQTIQTLRTLEEPLTIIVFYQTTHRLYGLVNDLLKEYERFSPHLRIERVDPEQDIAKARLLASEYNIEDLNLIVLKSGSRTKYLSDAELADFDYTALRTGSPPRLTAFKGEDAVTSAIISVTRMEAPLVWFTSGHGEKALDDEDPMGLSELNAVLARQDFTLETVTLVEREEIPDHVTLVVIAGPTHQFVDHEDALLQSYLERGGKLLVLIDPLKETGLAGLLQRWGIVVGNDVVVDPSQQLPFVSAANLLVTTYTQHPIVAKMKTLVTLYPLARSMQPTIPAPDGLTITSLALTTSGGWGETTIDVETFVFNDEEDLVGPVPIAVAVEQTAPDTPQDPGEAPPPLARIVAIGDSDFIANSQLTNVGNRDMLLGATNWLIEQEELIGIGPKSIDTIKLSLTSAQLTQLRWFSFLAMPLLCGVMGGAVWWRRRT